MASFESTTAKPRRVLRSVISSDLDALDRLQRRYPWVPNAARIRPSEERLALKRAKLAEIEATWASFTDYIRATVFGEVAVDVAVDTGTSSSESGSGTSGLTKKVVATLPPTDPSVLQKRFVPNDFPYDLAEGNHWVLWYAAPTQPCSIDAITADVSQHLQEHLRGSGIDADFDFAWYINPKMTVPEFFHVQVFWTLLPPPST
jgi:hypothetical protein